MSTWSFRYGSLLLGSGLLLCVNPATGQSDAQSYHSTSALCACPSPPPNLLTIWTSRWCVPCRAFWNDYSTDARFREALHTHWHIHAIDVDLEPRQAAAEWVTSVPTFDVPAKRITGYSGKEWLLRQLGAPPSSSPPRNLAPVTPLSDDAPEGDTHIQDEVVPVPQVPVPLQPSVAVPRTIPEAEIPAAPRNREPESNGPASEARRSLAGRLFAAIRFAAPVVLSGLELAGVIGGTAATGGLGAVGLALLLRVLRRRVSRKSTGRQEPDAGASASGGGGEVPRAPFPRELDEARQLLELRQSEGRVAVLDALRGMFLDDESDKLSEAGDPQTLMILQRLRAAIDTRVDEVAPLSVGEGSQGSGVRSQARFI